MNLRRRRLLLAAAALGVVLLALGVWYVLRPAPPAPPVIDLADLDPEVADAIRESREAVVRSPRSARAWGRLGMVLLVHNFSGEAGVALAEAERLDPKDPRWPYFQGMLFERGEPERALPKLRRAVELSHEPAPRLRLAEVLLAQGQLDEAEKLFHEVEREEPENPRAEIGLAQVARGRGDLDGCVAHLRRAADGPAGPNKNAHGLLAEVYGQMPGKEREAEAERDAVARLPDPEGTPDPYVREAHKLRVGIHARIGRAGDLLREGKLDAAIALLRENVERHPGSGVSWLELGRVRLLARDYPNAEYAFRQAVRCDPTGFEAHFRLGVALFAQRRRNPDAVARAAEAFRQAAKQAPSLHPAHYRLGLCLEEQGDRPGALAAYRAAVRCRPDYAEAHRQLGQLLAQLAVEAAVATTLDHLLRRPAVVDLAAPAWAEAEVHLRAAVRLAPRDRAARQALDRLEAAWPARGTR